MSSVATTRAITIPRSSLTQDDIVCLAATYDDVAQPIWIHDASSRCVYRNPAAMYALPTAGSSRFDILDHRGRTVGHLTLQPRNGTADERG